MRKHIGNALQAASSKGHEKVVKLLLEKGANINTQGGVDRNALQAACGAGHDNVVKILVEKGADINGQGGKYGTTTYCSVSSPTPTEP